MIKCSETLARKDIEVLSFGLLGFALSDTARHDRFKVNGRL